MPVQVEGVQVVVHQLDKLADDLADLPSAWQAIGDDTAAVAASLAPHRSGRLAGSVRAIAYRGEAVVTAGSSSVPYAGVVNYGWPARHIRADLFLERAGDQEDHHAAAVLEAEADKAITRRGFK